MCKNIIHLLLIMIMTHTILGCDRWLKSESFTPTVAYEQHIKPIFDKKCVICHSPSNMAPFSLDTFEDVKLRKSSALDSIKKGRMPPWAAKRECRKYHGDYSLTSEEKKLFSDWIIQGEERSLPSSSAYDVPELDSLPLTRVDLKLKNSEPYQPKPNPDETRCFVIDWPYNNTKFIIGNDVVPSDKSLVHHSSIYIAPADDREFYRNLDAKTDGPHDGYPCSATMGVGKKSARWIGGWLPGLTGFEYPLNAGMRIEPNAVVILQVHYNHESSSDNHHHHLGPKPIGLDHTEIHLKIADKVDLEGTLVTFTNPDWMVELEMDIPKNEKNIKHDFSGRIDFIPDLIGQEFPLKGDTFDIQSINMHGHALMSAAHMKVIRENGDEECLLDIPTFSSDWQLNYMLKQPVRVKPTDKVYLRCEWDNSPENQMSVDGVKLPSIDVNWGDGAREEMCFGLMFVTEVNDPD